MRVSDADDVAATNGSRDDSGVLANLPRARPQRASARRAAARNGSSGRVPRRSGAAKRALTDDAKRSPARKAPAKATAEAASKAPPKAARKRAVKSSDAPSAKPLAKGSVKAVRESAASSTARATRDTTSRRGRTQKLARPAPAAEPAPRQGFDSEGETASASVQPPGGIELVASAAELVGELAKAGVSTGERLLKDVLSRLPL